MKTCISINLMALEFSLLKIRTRSICKNRFFPIRNGKPKDEIIDEEEHQWNDQEYKVPRGIREIKVDRNVWHHNE